MNDPQGDSPTPYDDLPEVNSYDEIPEFSTEEEEAHFWGTHTLGPGLLKLVETRPVSERLEERRKLLARQRKSPRLNTRAR